MENKDETKTGINGRSKRGLEILQAALIIGILGDSLLRGTPWGLNFFLWITLLSVGLWVVVTRHRQEQAGIGTIALHCGLIFFAAMFAWRDSFQLLAADVVSILAIFAVLTLPAMNLRMQQSGLVHYLLGWAYSGLNSAIAPCFLIFADIKWNALAKGKNTKVVSAVVKGVLAAIPLVLIFGALFVAADAAYEKLVKETFHIDFEKIFGHVLLISFLSWIVAGYFRGAELLGFERAGRSATDELSRLLKDEENGEPARESSAKTDAPEDPTNLNKFFSLGTIELGVILGLTNLLFLSFVLVQIPYLFGGMDLVQNTENLKLAEYARRGFGELVWVAALVLPMLLLTHWFIKKGDKRSFALYRVLAIVQVMLLFIVMLSAAQRMLLYTGSSGYGLTTMRFYPMVFMAWLVFVFLWFGATVLRDRRQQFAWGALWSALGFLAILHVVNPDDFIARTNFALMHAGRSFDTNYMRSLSQDAVPAMLDELPALDRQHQCGVQADLVSRLIGAEEREADLRTWNWSRTNAFYKLSKAAGEMNAAGCNEAAPSVVD